MNINSVVSNRYDSMSLVSERNELDRNKEAYQPASGKRDSLEISSEAYMLQNNDEKISATSGKDTLRITRGDNKNTFVIHFSDSAIVSRVISRGYVTVNGVDIKLSDEAKEQLTNADKQVQADRVKAYNEYIMQHDLAVARQQGEAWKKYYEDLSETFEIAAKISNGSKVSSQEVKKLIEANPELYAMAMAAAAMSGKKAEQGKEDSVSMDRAESMPDETGQGVHWQDFEWKSYETQMTVSVENMSIQHIG